MKIGLDVSRMHALSLTRGIGYYAQNLYDSIKKYTDVDIKLIKEKSEYSNFDLIHFPFFDLFKHTLPINISKPFVVTIPDLIPLQFASHYPPGLKGRANLWLQKMSLKKANAVIAISKTVKEDVKKVLKIQDNKIVAIHLASSEIYKKITDKKLLTEVSMKYNLPEKFILYIGNINWNKNILNTAEASIKSGQTLVIVGNSFLDKSNINHPEKRSFKKFLEKYHDSPLIKLLGFVPDEDLVSVMNLATCLIFVSYYEGFGLPILEAQACQIPVITSKISATAEIAGAGAILVDPENPSEISNAISKLFDSEDLRVNLIKNGTRNLQNFSWKKTAVETVEVYKKCLEN